MNAYETHTTLGHTVTRHSPNGIDVIETCDTCGARFLLQSGHAPVTMRHTVGLKHKYPDAWQHGYNSGAIRFSYIPDYSKDEMQAWSEGYKAGKKAIEAIR